MTGSIRGSLIRDPSWAWDIGALGHWDTGALGHWTSSDQQRSAATNIFLLHAHGTKEEACVRARG
eukprot:CAMPEP_0182551672 /NCGR_PEP_ID=MMETSP1323-20130603/45774_1 /TAXON_ID=236787 /ORGANISM="Florenciella parvula, Strain RCC1693" /LENGTH=64 /DNA_ID=CAMNT_0024763293 /DNA_START=1 /DNA_END=195 /DNA_ORIENTATION=+